MMQQLLPALREAEAAYHTRVPTAALNRVIRDAQAAHPPPVVKQAPAPGALRDPGRHRSADVHAVRHPRVAPQYLRYLERKIRESFDLGPTPIKLRVRRRNG